MTTPDGRVHVLLAGGGTGGHVFPALAVGEALTGRGCAVSFAGRPAGFEARVVPERGVPFHPVASRPLVGRGPAGKLLALATLGTGAVGAARLVRRLGVDAVLGTGGYASAPAVLGAVLARRPVLLLEPNAQPGFANRKLARWAAGAAVAFEETCRELPCPCRATGVPVRETFFAVPDLEAEPGGAPELLVLGGSQGALSVNLALPRALTGGGAGEGGLLARVPGLTVVHQTGSAHMEATRAAYDEAGVPGEAVRLVPFIEDVAGAMARARLVVSRAGALTVAEIAAAGRPAVLVPLTLAEGHQRENARALERAGAARVVEARPEAPSQPELLAAALAPVLAELLAAPEVLTRMGRAARALARPGATGAIATWIVELAGGGPDASSGAVSAGAGRRGHASAGSAGLPRGLP
jgi:UDP-N-acetylglucosamine--N-acetylmuramyl-(pentapeptide) pyrophosphoryl-undecaprenol N-acetylglucosamine transferase